MPETIDSYYQVLDDQQRMAERRNAATNDVVRSLAERALAGIETRLDELEADPLIQTHLSELIRDNPAVRGRAELESMREAFEKGYITKQDFEAASQELNKDYLAAIRESPALERAMRLIGKQGLAKTIKPPAPTTAPPRPRPALTQPIEPERGADGNQLSITSKGTTLKFQFATQRAGLGSPQHNSVAIQKDDGQEAVIATIAGASERWKSDYADEKLKILRGLIELSSTAGAQRSHGYFTAAELWEKAYPRRDFGKTEWAQVQHWLVHYLLVDDYRVVVALGEGVDARVGLSNVATPPEELPSAAEAAPEAVVPLAGSVDDPGQFPFSLREAQLFVAFLQLESNHKALGFQTLPIPDSLAQAIDTAMAQRPNARPSLSDADLAAIRNGAAVKLIRLFEDEAAWSALIDETADSGDPRFDLIDRLITMDNFQRMLAELRNLVNGERALTVSVIGGKGSYAVHDAAIQMKGGDGKIYSDQPPTSEAAPPAAPPVRFEAPVIPTTAAPQTEMPPAAEERIEPVPKAADIELTVQQQRFKNLLSAASRAWFDQLLEDLPHGGTREQLARKYAEFNRRKTLAEAEGFGLIPKGQKTKLTLVQIAHVLALATYRQDYALPRSKVAPSRELAERILRETLEAVRAERKQNSK